MDFLGQSGERPVPLQNSQGGGDLRVGPLTVIRQDRGLC
jgi:hypothetical protein